MKIIYGYCRVSTTQQANEGYSIDYQKGAIEGYIGQLGSENKTIKLEVEEGKSGKTLNRPKIQKIINHIKQGLVSDLVFLKIDRITRSTGDFATLVELCNTYNVFLHSTMERLELTTAGGIMVSKIMSVMAEFEGKQISERTLQGLIAKAKRGEYPFSMPPYGYDKNEKHILVPNSKMPDVLNVIELRKLGISIDEISVRTGVSKQIVNKILVNRIYSGYVYIQNRYIKIVEPVVDIDFYLNPIKPYKTNRKIIARTNTYRYNFLVHNNEGQMFRHMTKKKKFKNGTSRMYIYYYLGNIFINEEKISSELEYQNDLYRYNVNMKNEKIEELFNAGQLNLSERNKRILTYKDKTVVDINRIYILRENDQWKIKFDWK